MSNQELELYKATVEAGTKALVKEFAGAGVETGEWLRDVVRFHRWKYQVRTMQRAKQFLDDAGIAPEDVSLKTLVPLLEGAALEDENEPTMADRWAALLANAAAGDHANGEVLPSFVSILAELSPEEAAILDRLYASAIPLDRTAFRTWPISVDQSERS
jgi:Abortive infection alpha